MLANFQVNLSTQFTGYFLFLSIKFIIHLLHTEVSQIYKNNSKIRIKLLNYAHPEVMTRITHNKHSFDNNSKYFEIYPVDYVVTRPVESRSIVKF